MSDILAMNESGLRQRLSHLVEYQRTRAGRRRAIIEKQAIAESELREHDMVDGILTEQVALINARLTVLAEQARPE